jgi:hypothetical protein
MISNFSFAMRMVSSYKWVNQKPLFEEGQRTQWQKQKGQTTIYKTLHRKLRSEQHDEAH